MTAARAEHCGSDRRQKKAFTKKTAATGRMADYKVNLESIIS